MFVKRGKCFVAVFAHLFVCMAVSSKGRDIDIDLVSSAIILIVYIKSWMAYCCLYI